uniref:Methylmalonic aciduria and homocystinuria type D protein, mitochondrial n=1 Tax=Clastoptera arizonana TaxID=38151 RepID=A0A1B6C171_9HEMI
MFKSILKIHTQNRSLQIIQQAFYSRRNNSKHDSSFKVVGSGNREDEFNNTTPEVNPNWELFPFEAPHDFRFYLPGKIGPAWHYPSSTASVTTTLPVDLPSILDISIQECPRVLRPGVLELFQGTTFLISGISIVTLSLKSKTKSSSLNDWDDDRFPILFLLAARNISKKIKAAGFWADFINPFSGLPYNFHHDNHKLYLTDERFRCLGFRIVDKGNCKVITDKGSRKFVGNLYTQAPENSTILEDILRQYNNV